MEKDLCLYVFLSWYIKNKKSQKCRYRYFLTTNFYAWTLNHSSYPWCLRSPGEGHCSKQGVEHRPDLLNNNLDLASRRIKKGHIQ